MGNAYNVAEIQTFLINISFGKQLSKSGLWLPWRLLRFLSRGRSWEQEERGTITSILTIYSIHITVELFLSTAYHLHISCRHVGCAYNVATTTSTIPINPHQQLIRKTVWKIGVVATVEVIAVSEPREVVEERGKRDHYLDLNHTLHTYHG